MSFGASSGALAHLDPVETIPDRPASSAATEQITGDIHHLKIHDLVSGADVDVYTLTPKQGRPSILRDAEGLGLATGDRVNAVGRRNGRSLFVSNLRKSVAAAPKALGTVSAEGQLALLHIDRFETGESEFIFELHDSTGKVTPLRFPVAPAALHRGMRVRIEGHRPSDGAGLVPDTVTITALPSSAASTTKAAALGAKTNTALVILMTFTDSGPIPFSQTQVQSVFAGGAGSGSVTEFFAEASYGQQLLSPTITPWLPTNAPTPANCDFKTMGSLGRTAAANAGYSVSSYQNLVYVFPQVAACGWIGLAYIGQSGVWINGRNMTSAYAHELGHNFGLLHAASLRCSAGAIPGSCSATEYGDPFDTMGNQSAMHYNAPQKLDLGWISAGTVVTHTTGTGTYTLSPLENGGGAVYAVKVPVASNRTYWLEYRQPVGFDSALSSYPNNGIQVRVAAPFETLCSGCDSYSDDTELLDMTPATSSFLDSALVVGNTFTDNTYGISVYVKSANSSAVTVQVTAPGGTSSTTPTTTGLASSANPVTAGSVVTFTATVTGSSPSGSVSFTDTGTSIPGCGAIALGGSGNTRTAACSTSALTAGTHSIAASYGGDSANAGSASSTLSQVVNSAAGTSAWIDDSIPAGAVASGEGEGWTWVSGNPAPFSGALAHQSPALAGRHQHYFYNSSSTLSVATGDTLYAYVYLDPAHPPSEVMLQWYDGSWEHRAYWGANLIGWGIDATVSRNYMGPLPAAGQWVRLAVPAAAVGLEGHTLNGMAFTLYDGGATWDQGGKSSSSATAWVDDAIPSGATGAGDVEGWSWVTGNPAPFSGGLAHQSALASGEHQHYFYNATATLPVAVGDTLYAYVYLDPSNLPSEVMLQWNDGSWEHRAYWGANLIAWGSDGTMSRKYMGALPPAGQWVRLAVPASAVGLEGRTLNGMAFTLYNGRATWDLAGK